MCFKLSPDWNPHMSGSRDDFSAFVYHVKVNTDTRGQCPYKHNIEARSSNRCCQGKIIRVTYSECVSVGIVIQHAMRMCSILSTSVARPVLPHFFTLSHTWENVTEYKKKCIDFLCNIIISETFFILEESSEIIL
jgi:hypothetical protein